MNESFHLPIVLIIADKPSIGYWLKKQLEGKFFVIDATSKSKAIEVALNTTVHCIILDAAFKACDCLELASEIRRTPSNLLTPILLITDTLKKSYRTSATEAGVTDFLFLPLDAEELQAKIEGIEKASNVRSKVLGLSARIGAPAIAASPSFFKNKVVLHDQALQLLAQAKNQNVSVRMLVIRIDRFKEIEAKLGPVASQEVLQNFADFLERSAGKNGAVERFTDGSFIVLLQDLGLDESKKVAENLRKLVEKQRFSTKQGILHLTASFAISEVSGTEKSVHQMLDAAAKSFDQLNNQIFFIDKKDS